jgi:transcriptional regulator of acetoin/glycerol metabolism
MQLGAFDYCIKTDKKERLFGMVRRALELIELRQENLRLRDSLLGAELRMPAAFANFITQNPRLRDIFRYSEAIAGSPEPVLITGESGTGKELIARAVHQLSCPQGPFVAVNAAGLDDLVFSDTLFGHKRGAYTGAQEGRAGMIEAASGGILFLDEIGDMPLALQTRLLRVLEERKVTPLGAAAPAELNIRLISASHHDLRALVAGGAFREDLYYRLGGLMVALPPLRERSDKAELLDHLLTEEAQGESICLDPAARQALLAYRWPGNVRQMRNLLRTLVALSEQGRIAVDEVLAVLPAEIGEADAMRDPLQSAEREALLSVLRERHWQVSRVAEELGISRNTLYRKLRKHGISRN